MSEPLAERMRPRTLADYVGQKHLVGEGAVLRKMIDAQTTRRYPDVCRWKNTNLFYNPQNHRNFSS